MEWNENYIKEAERTYGQRVQAACYYLVSRARINVSVSGTAKATSAFTGLGRTYTREQHGPPAPDETFVPGSRSIIAAFGFKGKKYKKGRRIYGANPSKPGEYPHKQYGTLRMSIAQDFNAATVSGRVGSSSKVARYLELGTRKMAPRKLFRATLAEEREKIVQMIVGENA